MKRFYKEVAVSQYGAERDEYSILLDGRPVRTPMRRLLHVPNAGLADRIAAEWREQGEDIALDAMLFTRLAATAVDRIADQRPDYVAEIAGFAETDLVCYRSPSPVELAERQARLWQPLVDWAGTNLSAQLCVTEGILPVEQDAACLDCLRAAVDAHDDHALAALGLATVASGSLVLALALSHGAIDPGGAIEASQLDEAYQAELWGEEAEAMKRRESLRHDIHAAHEYLVLLRGG